MNERIAKYLSNPQARTIDEDKARTRRAQELMKYIAERWGNDLSADSAQILLHDTANMLDAMMGSLPLSFKFPSGQS